MHRHVLSATDQLALVSMLLILFEASRFQKNYDSFVLTTSESGNRHSFLPREPVLPLRGKALTTVPHCAVDISVATCEPWRYRLSAPHRTLNQDKSACARLPSDDLQLWTQVWTCPVRHTVEHNDLDFRGPVGV